MVQQANVYLKTYKKDTFIWSVRWLAHWWRRLLQAYAVTSLCGYIHGARKFLVPATEHGVWPSYCTTYDWCRKLCLVNGLTSVCSSKICTKWTICHFSQLHQQVVCCPSCWSEVLRLFCFRSWVSWWVDTCFLCSGVEMFLNSNHTWLVINLHQKSRSMTISLNI